MKLPVPSIELRQHPCGVISTHTPVGAREGAVVTGARVAGARVTGDRVATVGDLVIAIVGAFVMHWQHIPQAALPLV